jgi:hypothetical protein
MDQPKPAPELPDPLEAEYPVVAEAINARTKPLREAVVRAEEVGKATLQQLTEMREARFFDAVTAAVPELEQYNADPEFVAWCVEIPTGEDERRQDKLNRYRSTANSKAAIGLLAKWVETKKTKSPVVVAEEPAPKKDKPTKEAQVQVPSSAAPSNTVQKSVQNDKARLAELETKVFKLGMQATKEDMQELERLYVEAEKRGELK